MNLCRLATAAAIVAVTSCLPAAAEQPQAMLSLHNAHRAKHCVPAMTWSPQLAAQAQAWAAKCAISHSAANERPGQGESLAWGTGGFATAQSSASRWYNEISKYNFNAPGFSNETGHFTQMVWKASTQLGCGVANCNGQTYWVCRYGPSGNITNPGQFAANVPKVCKTTGGSPPPPPPTGGPNPPPPSPTTPGTAGKAVKVKLDVDLYAQPGGVGKPKSILKAGTAKVTLVSPCRADNWCNVKWPQGQGWVYTGPDYPSLER